MRQYTSREGYSVTVANNAEGAVVVEMLVGSDTYVKRHVLDTVRVGKAKRLDRLLAHIPGKQRAILIGTRSASATYGTVYLEGEIQAKRHVNG